MTYGRAAAPAPSVARRIAVGRPNLQ